LLVQSPVTKLHRAVQDVDTRQRGFGRTPREFLSQRERSGEGMKWHLLTALVATAITSERSRILCRIAPESVHRSRFRVGHLIPSPGLSRRERNSLVDFSCK